MSEEQESPPPKPTPTWADLTEPDTTEVTPAEAASILGPSPLLKLDVETIRRLVTYETEEAAREIIRKKVISERVEELEAERKAKAEDDGRATRLRQGGDVLQSTTIPWLVEGIFHEQGLGQLSAPENTGKSIITVGLALAIANGMDEWAGHKIDRTGPVVYCAMEGGPVIQSYIHAWLTAHPGTDLEQFYLLDEETLDLSTAASLARFDQDIDQADIEPVLIVFDTQLDVTGGTDEMTPEMGHLLAQMRLWLVRRGCFGLFLHHPPYGAKRGRGSTSVRGKCDVLLYADKDDATIDFQKVKGATLPNRQGFRIETVPGSSGAIATFPSGLSMGALAASAGSGKQERDDNTYAVLTEILARESPGMVRARNPTQGWGATEIINALKGYATRSLAEGGPVNVHTSNRFVDPILANMEAAGLVVDHSVAWTTGKRRAWRLVPPAH